MVVEDTRARLVELEVEAQERAAYLQARRAELEALLTETEHAEDTLQQIRREKEQTRRELEREEALAQVEQDRAELDERKLSYLQKFQRRAEGKTWNDGLFMHQWQGMMFGAVAERWILGDEMGLGKTRTSVGWLDLVQAKKVLVVCESNIADEFAGEIMELAPHRELFNLYAKTPKTRHELLDTILSRKEAVVVVNFEIWRKDKDALAKLLDWRLDTIIVDEAHNLKTTSTSNYKYIQTLIETDNVCPRCRKHIRGLYDPEALKAKKKVPRPCPSCGWRIGDPTGVRYRNRLEEWLSSKSIKNVCLTTGTPILNEPGDLYSLLHLCDPILFRSRRQFLTTYCMNNHHAQKWEFRPQMLAQLKPLIAGRFLARTYQDAGIVVPPQREHIVRVDLDKQTYPKQFRTIRQISEAAQIILDSGESMTIMHLISLITRKRQANVWPGGIVMTDKEGNVLFDAGIEVTESVKMDVLLDKLEAKHAEGHRQVVFSQFKTGLAELEARILARGIRAVRFDGDTPQKLRTEVKANFNKKRGEAPRWDVVLANYKTGGSGLNLTAATITHILDEEWNPGKKHQAYRRTSRIGQDEETEVYVYRIPGTIDTFMSNTIKRKQDIIDGFTETMTDKEAPDLFEDFKTALTTGEML